MNKNDIIFYLGLTLWEIIGCGVFVLGMMLFWDPTNKFPFTAPLFMAIGGIIAFFPPVLAMLIRIENWRKVRKGGQNTKQLQNHTTHLSSKLIKYDNNARDTIV